MATTPWGTASVRLARPGPVAQISSGSSPCCAGGETGHSPDMAAGAPHSAGVPALATAATSRTQSAAAIKRIPHPLRADADCAEHDTNGGNGASADVTTDGTEWLPRVETGSFEDTGPTFPRNYSMTSS